ncbi:hypothetical protein SUGI_1069230 [Cryptomeria japonica]|uniref:NAC domain-containing protein 79 n=1 Tax=Cryptomeria japonica TaxID=3369 RepID=UPI0024149A06|nr:NAC domain-containing protein 79 [Cryptomeria japonica]GLJ50231.1 hypothetical protein SUGI_1069230 [Cryptomeria japonica]
MESMNVKMMNKIIDDENLPPGFRFHPMDEELVTYYLHQKVLDSSFACRAIAEVDLNKCEPWDLPARAKMGEKEWYFFSLRDRKYPTGLRTNRATQAGYWKATGKDREVFKGRTSILVGMKKTLVFYKGRAPKGEKSNWVMHEYRLEGKFSYSNLPKTAKDEWVVTRIFQKSCGPKKGPLALSRSSNYLNDLDSPALPPLSESSPYVPSNGQGGGSGESVEQEQHVPCFSTPIDKSSNNSQFRNPSDTVDYSFLHNIMQNDPIYNPNALRYSSQDLHLNAPYHQLSPFSMDPNPPSFPMVSQLFSQGGLPSSSILRAIYEGVSGNEVMGLKQCKMEPPSSFAHDRAWEMNAKYVRVNNSQPQAMVSMSQETGLTSEINNTEISSVVSSQLNQHYPEDQANPSSVDFSDLWSPY